MSSGGKVNSNFDMDMGPVDVDMEGELKYLQYSFFFLNRHFSPLFVNLCITFLSNYSDLVNFCFRQILKIHKENEKIRK